MQTPKREGRLLQALTPDPPTRLSPIKYKKKQCAACGTSGSQVHMAKINTPKFHHKNMINLLLKYGKVYVADGYLCLTCERTLLSMDSKIEDFRRKCSTTRRHSGFSRSSASLLSPLRSSALTHTVKIRKLTPESNHYPETCCHSSLPRLAPKPLAPKPMKTAEDTISTSTPSTIDHHYSKAPLITESRSSDIAKTLSIALKKVNNSEEHFLVESLCRRKHGKLSVLMRKNYSQLETMNWEAVVQEMHETFPCLTTKLLDIMLAPGHRHPEQVDTMLPRLGVVYGIVLQARNKELSLTQRLLSCILTEAMCDVKVYDRLRPLGLTVGHTTSQDLVRAINGEFNSKLVDAIRSDKLVRLVGDNIDFSVGVRYEREHRHPKLMHYFGSAAIIYDLKFPHLDDILPQKQPSDIQIDDFLFSEDDISHLIDDFSYLAMKVAITHIPYFSFLETLIPKHLLDKHHHQLLKKTPVVPLTVMPKNEAKYADVVHILQQYETLLQDLHENAGISIGDKKIHVGGDQLTRERFSGAKLLVIGEESAAKRFDHLSPITAEFFHMQMKLLALAFKRLYKNESGTALGTMRSVQDRIQRTGVKEEVKTAYSADSDFFVSFTNAYIVEAICQYFDLEDKLSTPTTKVAPDDQSRRYEWARIEFRAMIQQHVGLFVYRTNPDRRQRQQQVGQGSEAHQQLHIQVQLPDGQVLRIPLGVAPPKNENRRPVNDHVENHAMLVLELGLLFQNFSECIKVPNRARMLRTLKVMMVLLKADNNLSKYADEILRFLVHQLCILPERQAHEEFFMMFVNNHGGKVDGHIPVDLQMEYIVKAVKKQIQHMFSNKTEANIVKKTGAIASLGSIVDNFDKATKVIVRNKKHRLASAYCDEVSMSEDLREVRPFRHRNNRRLEHFSNINCSLLHGLDYAHFRAWLYRRAQTHAYSLGN